MILNETIDARGQMRNDCKGRLYEGSADEDWVLEIVNGQSSGSATISREVGSFMRCGNEVQMRWSSRMCVEVQIDNRGPVAVGRGSLRLTDSGVFGFNEVQTWQSEA